MMPKHAIVARLPLLIGSLSERLYVESATIEGGAVLQTATKPRPKG